MRSIPRPLPFVLASTNHGTMIVNRNDFRMVNDKLGYGVGFQLLNQACFDPQEVDLVLDLLKLRKEYFGEGVVAIDCGANIGVHTIEWGRFMYGWGKVIAFEPQEKLYYALAGNIAINNCFNVTAKLAAVGASVSKIDIPNLSYELPSSYGSLSIKQDPDNEYIGQQVNYSDTTQVPLISVDSLKLSRLDFIKMDVEGMEEEVLEGSVEVLDQHKPILLIEIIKSKQIHLERFLKERGYCFYPLGIVALALHVSDPIMNRLHYEKGSLRLL